MKSSNGDPGALWANVKTWLKWGNSGPPSKIITDTGDMVSSPEVVADTMNNFFNQQNQYFEKGHTKIQCRSMSEAERSNGRKNMQLQPPTYRSRQS